MTNWLGNTGMFSHDLINSAYFMQKIGMDADFHLYKLVL
ncbi:hypothetical protein BN1221_00371c [Brenneria goodwinii]|uniref:Uncharacterized protein n=1 Tax=Brenneria goodwinii TaxID=1109412 RepID=A0A0G4JPV5_9GAMM|nr:hypothetical protein BN1221_00371c [Brenneria goodwinii]